MSPSQEAFRARRYSRRKFPPYGYVPGKSPHPRRHRDGHSFGLPEPGPARADPEAWERSQTYRFAVDLFNHGYWWECHEAFEALWIGAGRKGRQADFLKGLIQVAAAHLKHASGKPDAARRLAERGLARLARAGGTYMGLEVDEFARETRAYFSEARDRPAIIGLRLREPLPARKPSRDG
jgi:predicted metal-dependent hydrolase